MPTRSLLRLPLLGAAVVAAATVLAACEQNGRPVVRADTFPMGVADDFSQPIPDKPLFGSNDYVRERQVWPVALADVGEPLPPAVPLPPRVANIEVIEVQESTGQPIDKQGGSHPASGMAQGITNAQGGSETNTLDGKSK